MCSLWTGPGGLGLDPDSPAEPRVSARVMGTQARQRAPRARTLPGSDTSCDTPRAANRPSACAPARPGIGVSGSERARPPWRRGESWKGEEGRGAPLGGPHLPARCGAAGASEGCGEGQVPGRAESGAAEGRPAWPWDGAKRPMWEGSGLPASW